MINKEYLNPKGHLNFLKQMCSCRMIFTPELVISKTSRQYLVPTYIATNGGRKIPSGKIARRRIAMRKFSIEENFH